MKILLVLAGVIILSVATWVRGNNLKMLIPVTRRVSYSDDKMRKTTILHFGKPTKNISLSDITETKFFVKMKGNSLFCGKTVTRVDDLENGTTKYDDSGYKFMLNQKEIKKAFEHAERVAPTY